MKPHNGTRTITTLVPTIVPVIVFTEQEVKLELRPWKISEVPVGAFIKCHGDRIQRIIGVDPKHSNIQEPAVLLSNAKYRGGDDHYFLCDLVTRIFDHTYSLDGVNWHRCGVWEIVK